MYSRCVIYTQSFAAQTTELCTLGIQQGTQKEGTNTEKRQGSCRSHACGEKKTDKGRHVQQLTYQGIKPAPTSQELVSTGTAQKQKHRNQFKLRRFNSA